MKGVHCDVVCMWLTELVAGLIQVAFRLWMTIDLGRDGMILGGRPRAILSVLAGLFSEERRAQCSGLAAPGLLSGRNYADSVVATEVYFETQGGNDVSS